MRVPISFEPSATETWPSIILEPNSATISEIAGQAGKRGRNSGTPCCHDATIGSTNL